MKARRSNFANLTIESTTHAGLWMDKFLADQTEPSKGKSGEARDAEVGAKARLLREIGQNVNVPSGYRAAIRLRAASFSGRTVRARATTAGRMVIGLGARGALEAGLALERTWGVPILPGSALKGVAAAAARKLLEGEGDQWRRRKAVETPDRRTDYEILFGTTDDLGGVIFHDAWWAPSKGDTKVPIDLDVMTVHHADYYVGKTRDCDIVPPSDMDSPNPVSFATVHGDFAIVLEATGSLEGTGGADGWLGAALAILSLGLRELGIGAKTNSGYGRMHLYDENGQLIALPAEHARA